MKTYKCGKCQVTFGTSKQLQFHRESQHFNGFDVLMSKSSCLTWNEKNINLEIIDNVLEKIQTSSRQTFYCLIIGELMFPQKNTIVRTIQLLEAFET